MSTGRMETMEPPESVGGAPVTQPAEPGDPGAEAPFDEPERPVGADVDPEVLPDDGEGADLAVAEGELAPPVVAVVVTSGEGTWLTPALGSLAAQDYPALQVLVLDNAADDDPTARIAAELPTAYVRRLDVLASLGRPVVIGFSRKSSLGRLLGDPEATTGPLAASLAAAVTAYERGATILRVHDVRETVEALAVAKAVVA